MSAKAFYLAASEVLFIANDPGGDDRYAARRQLLPPQAQISARRHDTHETVLVVVAGTLEFMVGGAAGPVAAGSFVRVPAGTFDVFVINLVTDQLTESGSVASSLTQELWYSPYVGEVRSVGGYYLVGLNFEPYYP